MTEITSSINSRFRWKINHSGPGCSFYEFYEWYIFQQNTCVYIMNFIVAFNLVLVKYPCDTHAHLLILM